MVKEIIYTVIAKEKNKVLTEYTEHRGNFETIGQNILSKVKTESRATICFEKEYVLLSINIHIILLCFFYNASL
jgi:hypothetical protein